MLNNKFFGVLLTASLLTACGSGENVLGKAAEGRWNALISGDMQAAYQYYTKAFQETTPLDMFKHKVHSGLWKKAEVTKVTCTEPGKRCDVDVEVTAAIRMRGLKEPMESSATLHEVWVKDGWFSDWRYVN